MSFNIKIDKLAIADIQSAVDYYDEQQVGLGDRFLKSIDEHFSVLSLNPFFKVRYAQVRCLPLSDFPFMVHFTIDEIEQEVIVRAVFHTSLDPVNWDERSVNKDR